MEELIGADLLPMATLNELATVTRDDLKDAIAEWERKPPDRKWKYALRAEPINTER